MQIFAPIFGFPMAIILSTLLFGNELNGYSYLAIGAFLILYFLGLLTARTVQSVRGIEQQLDLAYVQDYVNSNPSIFKWIGRVSWFFLSCLVVVFLLYGTKDIQYFRFNFMRLMGGVKVVVILTTLVYIYVVRLYLRFLSERRWTSLAAVMVILVLMSLMGSRTYPFIIIIMGVVLFNVVGVLSNKKIFILGAIAVFFLIGLRYRTIQKLPPETYKWYVENQIIIPGSQVKSVYNLTTRTFRNIYKRNHEIFNGVPASFPFLHGESLFFQFYALALPGKQQNPHIRLNHELFKGSDTEVAYPPTILSQFYLDFGWFGQILGPFLLGFIFQLMYYKLMVQRNFYYLFLFLFTNYAMYISLYGAFPLFNVFFVAIIGLMFTVSFKFNSALESS